VIKISQAAAALGRLGGIAKSKKKAETARENGKKGGRPLGSKKKTKESPTSALSPKLRQEKTT
jgi:hypothetical protein